MAARRRGEDIIDFSMGNPDGATPPHIVENYVLWPSARTRMVTPLHAAFRGYVAPFPTGIRIATTLKSTRNQKPSSLLVRRGLAHLMLATLDHGDTVLVPNPSYPIHIYGAVIAGAQVRSVPLVEGVDFFNELERAIRESYPKPKMMILGFPSNPTAQCVELEFFEK